MHMYSRRAAREAYCSLTGRPNKMKMNVRQNIIQYQGTKKQQQGQQAKTTKLCASAIGICAIPP